MAGENCQRKVCIWGISPTESMVKYCTGVQHLYTAIGYSDENSAVDKPVHQKDIHICHALNEVKKSSEIFNDWADSRKTLYINWVGFKISTVLLKFVYLFIVKDHRYSKQSLWYK